MLSPGTGRERKGEVGMLFSHAKAPINVAPAASSPATSPACLRVGVLPTENVADQLHCTSAHTVATDSPLRCEALSSPRSYWEVLLGQPTMIGGERSPSPMLLCQQAVKSNDLAQVVAHVQHHGIEMRGKNGFQALHFASCYGKCDIAAYLLHPLGADVNAQTARGNTPLHIACFENFLPMIELLVRHGADFTVLNWQQKNAVDMAQRTYTLQTLMRALSARGGGVLMDPSEKLWLHYYKFFGLTVGAGEAQLGPSFKKTLKNIFTKRDMSDEQRHVDLQEACEAYLVLRSRWKSSKFCCPLTLL